MTQSNTKVIPVRDNSKVDGRTAARKIAERVGTPTLMWLLVKRHKVAILVLGNVILVLNWVFPPWADIVSGFVTSLF